MFRSVTPFNVADSALVGLVSALTCIVIAATLDAGIHIYSVIVVCGTALAVLVLFIGARRGAGNVDGVFLGPRLRTMFVVGSVASISFIIYQTPWAVSDTPQALAEIAYAKESSYERSCENKVKAIRALLNNLASGSITNPIYNSLHADLRYLKRRKCEFDSALRDQIMSIPKPSVASVDTGQRGVADDLADELINGDPVGKPKPRDVVATPSTPSAPQSRDKPDSTIVTPSTPPYTSDGTTGTENRTRITKTTRRDAFTLLFGFFGSLGLGSTKITTDEFEAVVQGAASVVDGNPVEDLFDKHNLSPEARRKFMRAMIRYANSAASDDTDFAARIKDAFTQSKADATCASIIHAVTGDMRYEVVVPISNLMTERKELRHAKQRRFDETVYDCFVFEAGADDELVDQLRSRYQEEINLSAI